MEFGSPARRAPARHRDRLPGPRAGRPPLLRGERLHRPRGPARRACSGRSGVLDRADDDARAPSEAFDELAVPVTDVAARCGALRRAAAGRRDRPGRDLGAGRSSCWTSPPPRSGCASAAPSTTLIKSLRSRDFGVLLISHDVPQVLDDRRPRDRAAAGSRTRAPASDGGGRRRLDRERDGGRLQVSTRWPCGSAAARGAPATGRVLDPGRAGRADRRRSRRSCPRTRSSRRSTRRRWRATPRRCWSSPPAPRS